MSRGLRILIVLFLLAPLGCAQTSKIKDPIAPPAPLRRTPEISGTVPDENRPRADSDQPQETPATEKSARRTVLPTSTFSDPDEPTDSAAARRAGGPGAARTAASPPESSLLARVAGKPIFLEDVLEAIAPQLLRDRTIADPAQRQRAQEETLRQGLQGMVDRDLLLRKVEKEWKEPQLALARKEAAKEFEERLKTIMRELGVSTESELNARLVKEGTSLEKLRKNHEASFLAQQFLRTKIGYEITVSRQELLHDYEEKLARQYTRPARVKWQHLEVALAPDHRTGLTSQCRCAACQQGRRLRAKLDAGADFDELAKEHSDDPKAAEGGRWDWTTPGSLSDDVLNAALFSLPKGHVSPVLEGSSALHILRVLERDEGGVIPFREAQKEVRQSLQQRKLQEAAKDYLEALHAQADVEYFWPKHSPGNEATPSAKPL